MSKVFGGVVCAQHRQPGEEKGQDSLFYFRRLSVMHTMRNHSYDKTATTRHLYQGRFKSFPIQNDEHLLTVMRYVERNPVRANFVNQAENWQWGSAHAHQQPADQRLWLATPSDPLLPRQWRSWVNKPQTDAEVKALRACIQRGLSPSATTAGSKAAPSASASKARLVPEDAPEKTPWPLRGTPERGSTAARKPSWTGPAPTFVRLEWE